MDVWIGLWIENIKHNLRSGERYQRGIRKEIMLGLRGKLGGNGRLIIYIYIMVFFNVKY